MTNLEEEMGVDPCSIENKDNRPFIRILNVLFDKWRRVIGKNAYIVLESFQRFTKNNKKVVFAQVRQKDWAEWCDMSLTVFRESLQILTECGLIEVIYPEGSDICTHRPCKYILNKIPDEVPSEFLHGICAFSNENVFGDPIFDERYHMFRKKINRARLSESNSLDYRNPTVVYNTRQYNNKTIKDSSFSNEKEVTHTPVCASTRTKQPMSERIRQKVDKDSHPVKVCPKNNFVEHWNSFPFVRHHKDPSKKVYKEAVRLFNQLKKGTFASCNDIDKDWLKKNGIPEHRLSREWRDSEIIHTLTEMVKIFMNGYLPENKSMLPKSLPDMLYNPRTRHSLFFLYNHKKVKRVEAVTCERGETKLDTETQACFKELKSAIRSITQRDLTISEHKQLIAVISEIKNEYITLDVFANKHIGMYISTLIKFCMEYKKFLESCYTDFKEISPVMLKPKTRIWNAFIQDFEESIGVKIPKKGTSSFVPHKKPAPYKEPFKAPEWHHPLEFEADEDIAREFAS